MSESLLFQVFYGLGEVRYGSEGVDLSEFKSFTKQVLRARQKTWGSVCNWLFKAFSLDREQHELSVMAVVRFRMDIIFWELMPLGGTQNWRDYVNIATERGLPLVLFVQVFQKIGSSSQEATREAPKVTHTYPVTRDQNFNIPSEVIAAIEAEASHNMENYMYMAPHEHESAYKRIKDYCARFWRAMSYRGGHANIHLPPRPLYPGSSSQPAYPGSSSAAPTHVAHPGSSSGPPVRPQWIATLTSSSSYTPHPTRTLGAGSSSRGPRVDDLEYTGRGGTNKEEEAEDIERRTPWTIQMANSLFSANLYPEEINASQLSGVTLAPTQVSHEAFTTLIAYQAGRSACHVGPAEHHTFSQRNTKEVQVADRRAGKTAESAQRHKRGRI